jgi:nitronate monooxygenase
MPLRTRLTEKLKIRHPVLSAPMALAAGGALAAAVSNAGGLGLIGGGYGDSIWLHEQFYAAGNARVGCGFITWSLRSQPELLDLLLSRQPAAVFLSFDDPQPFADAITASGAVLIVQVQSRRDAERAIDCGAAVVVAQGAEAGGHGETRGTMALVPEIADLLAKRAPDTLLCAAGGIADGRGLAASLMLGADGVVVGSRFWASKEALVHPNLHEAAMRASGDDTLRTKVPDIARRLEWPERFTIRVLHNAFTRKWHGREEDLIENAEEATKWRHAWATGDSTTASTIVGEAVGLINDVKSAGTIVEALVSEAEQSIGGAQSTFVC